MSYLLIKKSNMRYVKFIAFLIACVLFVNGYAQKATPKTTPKTTQKTNANDPNKKALNKYSKEKMFTPAPASTQKLTPNQIQSKEFFDEGSKKGKAGNYNGAIEDFTKSLILEKNAGTYLKRGYAYQMIANYTAAIDDANEALKLQPSLTRAYFVRGISHYGKGELKDARTDLSTFIAKDRTNAIAFNFMAALCYMDQDYKNALANYDEVVRLDPKYPDIYTNRGMMRHTLQDYKGAIQDYNEALKLNPNNPSAYNNRGGAYMMLKDFQSALADFDKAIAINDKYADAYDNRGRVKHTLGDVEGACADWQSAYDNGLEASKELIIKYCK